VTDPAPYADPPRVSPVDRVLTVLLLVGLAVLVPIAGFLGLLTSMASDGCIGGNPCNTALMTVGIFTSALSPVVVGLGALGWVIVRWVRGRSTWWVPLVAVVVGALLWIAGALVTASGVG
jgi:hypothetical protein